jgi:hypothetical protein
MNNIVGAIIKYENQTGVSFLSFSFAVEKYKLYKKLKK